MIHICPSGADAEHRQPSKTINAEVQKKLRDDKRRAKLVREYNEATVSHNTIRTIFGKKQSCGE